MQDIGSSSTVEGPCLEGSLEAARSTIVLPSYWVEAMKMTGLYSIACVLVICLVAVDAGSRRKNRNNLPPRKLVVQISRLAGQDSANVPHKYSKGVNHDYQWVRITGDNAEQGDITSFTAYEDEYEERDISSREVGGFEKRIHVCRSQTPGPQGRPVATWLLRPGGRGRCSRGWEEEFSFYVAEEEREDTEEIHVVNCRDEESGMLFTRVSTDHRISCGREEMLNKYSFYAEVGRLACKTLQNPEHTRRADPTVFGDVLISVSFVCQHGYQLPGGGNSMALSCGRNGLWSDSPQPCEPITCPDPPQVAHGSPSSQGPYRYLTEIAYDCMEGYELYPRYERIQCLEDGQWSQNIARCQAIDCGVPTNIENGDFSAGPYTYNNEVEYYCDSGYVLHGPSSATCLASGQWSDSRVPTCEVLRCTFLMHPEHGTFLVSGQTAGSEVIVKCHTGYRLVGSAVMRCEQIGEIAEWSGDAPQCERIMCDAPVAPENGAVLGSDFSYDAQVTYTCDSGFILRGADRAQCAEMGWDAETPTCEVLRCRDPGTPEGAERDVDSGEEFMFGTLVKYTCMPGHLMEGSQTLLCQEDGRWSDVPPTCEAVHCTPLNPPQFGASDVDHFQTGGEALFTCSPGYELNGPSASTCEVDGTWSHPVPECRPCPMGSYKEGANDEACEQCPEHSNTTTMASFSHRHCMCLPGTTGPLGGPCNAIMCEPLIAPQDGSITPCGHANHDECHFDCEPGFYLQGSRIRKCTSNGWTGNPPTCSECPANTYKTHAAAMTCIPCPRNSGTPHGLGTSVDACECLPGYRGPAGGPCEDLDECAADNGGCSQGCINTPGSFYCTCTIPGYELADDSITCQKTRSCEEITQIPANGNLSCRYTEDTNGYICHISCDETYFFVSGVNNYITCGSETDFMWSHQVMNSTARLPSCTKEFFVDVDLPISLKFTSDEMTCENQAPITSGYLKANLQEVANSIDVCDSRCEVHGMSAVCTRSEAGDSILQVDFKIMIKNPEENAVTPGCETSCQRQNMRQIISNAFSLRTAMQQVVSDEPDRLNLPDYEETTVISSFFRHGRPDILCIPGRVYTKNRLCVPCDSGFYHPERTLKTCVACPMGTYQNLQGQTFCKPCLEGSSTLMEGADHPTMCTERVEILSTPAPSTEEGEDDVDDYGEYSLTEEDLAELL